jgi:hypothetical protein
VVLFFVSGENKLPVLAVGELSMEGLKNHGFLKEAVAMYSRITFSA